ncbi:MAG: DUF2339 domain-containing protein [Ginsengibacter sp.]
MADEQELHELLQKIDRLSSEIEKYREEINLISKQVASLRNDNSPVSDVKYTGTHSIPKVSSPGLENFIGLKLINFVGIIILIIGLTIGVKYAIDSNLISPAMRIILTYIAGALLFFISVRLRKIYALFSVILFGGAMASAYFTTYAAFEYYALISRFITFTFMLVLTFLTVYASLKYSRQEIAILGLVGAYGIPFFVKGNSDNVVSLFSFIFFINAGVLLISFKKYWLSLTYISFFTTWLIYVSWVVLYSGNHANQTGTLFCYAFFIFFLLNSLLFKAVKRLEIDTSDTFLVIVNSLLFYLSLILLYKTRDITFVENITLAFGILYLMAALLVIQFMPLQRHFYNGLFSISLTALVSFTGIKFMGFTLTIIWVFMAVIFFIVGVMYRLKIFRIASILLFTATLFKLLLIDTNDFTSVEKVIAYIFIGIILLIISYLYQKFKKIIFDEKNPGEI